MQLAVIGVHGMVHFKNQVSQLFVLLRLHDWHQNTVLL